MIHDVGFGVKFIKDYNELKVLRFIKNNQKVSRAEISKQYNISKAAVSDIVNRLIIQGYVSETGVGSSTKRGGRKPVLLNFNQKAGYVIGIEIKRSFARVALIDLDTNIYEFKVIEFEENYMIKATTLESSFPITFTRIVTGDENSCRIQSLVEGDTSKYYKLLEPFIQRMIYKIVHQDYYRLKDLMEQNR